jgi:glycosyltransferase involved in cell wall biosynthesis
LKLPLISIVVPVLNERDSIERFIAEIGSATQKLRYTFEIIFVVDPSIDGTEELLENLAGQNKSIKMIRLSRRFGQPAATMAGLENCNGVAAIVMDVDLQDPPAVIPSLVFEWEIGNKVVLAQRRTRTGEPYLKKLVSNFGYSFLNRFADVPIPPNAGDFRLIDRAVIEELRKFPEANAFLRGLVALVGFKSSTVFFDRPGRTIGKTHYNRFFGSFKIAFNGIVGYSSALLTISTFIGIFFSIIAMFLGTGYGLAKILGASFPIGNPTIVVAVLFVGGINLFAIGILGVYVSRVYDEVKQRPRYIIEQKLGFSKEIKL